VLEGYVSWGPPHGYTVIHRITVPSSAYCCVFGLGGVGPKSGK
jgi:hypothetical protein